MGAATGASCARFAPHAQNWSGNTAICAPSAAFGASCADSRLAGI
ncbi:hypothetical protein L195_g058211 [Trifolium pratense]|uniref:Uncharacterized protein n=1 Tax=Trifolium pratense TaxID=57577 RepID=A0A2K3JQY0_TRIPR|nr:hypothetical protein L195_g058211 [Trifolium pratense]